MADCKKYNGSTWEHSLRKLTTATDTLTTLPADLYADGNNATVGLVGNMEQTGTPTPQNPIQPSECGERTGNLFDGTKIKAGRINSETGIVEYASDTSALSFADETVTISTSVAWRGFVTDFISTQEYLKWSYVSDTIMYGYEFAYDENKEFLGAVFLSVVPTGTKYIRISFQFETTVTNAKIKNFMLNTGSTALPYEPYGYKIPISSGGVTTNIYLGSTQTTRQIKKYVVTGDEDVSNYDYDYQRFLLTIPTIPSMRTRSTPIICTHYIGIYDGRPVAQVPMYAVYTGSDTDNSVLIKTDQTTDRSTFIAWLQEQYANGTPVTILYALSTPETAVVNEPLRKIGDYADTVSGITIPTTTGADSFDVLTTLKPSEVSLSYTGWHDASVGEWGGSEWQ